MRTSTYFATLRHSDSSSRKWLAKHGPDDTTFMYARTESEIMKFTVALLQITPSGDDQNRNLAIGLEYCRKAKALGADLAVFPELWNIGFAPSPIGSEARQVRMDSAIDQRSTFFQTFAAMARELDMNIAITYLEAHRPMPRNTVSVINRRGEVVLNHSKAFICDFGKDETPKAKPKCSGHRM